MSLFRIVKPKQEQAPELIVIKTFEADVPRFALVDLNDVRTELVQPAPGCSMYVYGVDYRTGEEVSGVEHRNRRLA